MSTRDKSVRYAVICFRGDQAYRWEGVDDIACAEAACAGVALCNLDDFVGYVYDLDAPGLIYDAEETPHDWMQAKCTSADVKMAVHAAKRKEAR
jgi:hypothetical protein